MLIDLFFREKPKANKIFEYQWPQGKGGEYHVLQEQISEFLGVLSFKRKYPGQFHMFCRNSFWHNMPRVRAVSPWCIHGLFTQSFNGIGDTEWEK